MIWWEEGGTAAARLRCLVRFTAAFVGQLTPPKNENDRHHHLFVHNSFLLRLPRPRVSWIHFYSKPSGCIIYCSHTWSQRPASDCGNCSTSYSYLKIASRIHIKGSVHCKFIKHFLIFINQDCFGRVSEITCRRFTSEKLKSNVFFLKQRPCSSRLSTDVEQSLSVSGWDLVPSQWRDSKHLYDWYVKSFKNYR